MIASRTEAKDFILALVKAVTDAQSLFVIWEDTDKNTKDQRPDAGTPHCRVRIRHRAGETSSLANESGKNKHDITGFVFIEIMTPIGDGSVDADTYAQAFESAFRSASGGDPWYSGVVSQEVGNTNGWFKTNTIAMFHYELIE